MGRFYAYLRGAIVSLLCMVLLTVLGMAVFPSITDAEHGNPFGAAALAMGSLFVSVVAGRWAMSRYRDGR